MTTKQTKIGNALEEVTKKKRGNDMIPSEFKDGLVTERTSLIYFMDKIGGCGKK